MATMAELAAAAELKKKPPLPPPDGTRLVLSTSAKGNSMTGGSRNSGALSRPIPPTPLPGPQDRLLGTEQLADLIPMDWPQSEPAKTWNEARLTPVKDLGVILSHDQTRAWLSLCSPGTTPLLLHHLPVLGRLSTSPAELAAIAAPCGNSHGNDPSGKPMPASPQASAQPAGSDTFAPFPSEPAPAPGTSSFERLCADSRQREIQAIGNLDPIPFE